MRIGNKNKETAITVLEAFKIAIRKKGQINVREENEEETIEYIDMAIEALESQSKIDGWIPCSERLPEESLNSVIGWDKYRNRCCFVQYYDGRWILGDDTESVRIIAWQPLPEAYQIHVKQSEDQERSEVG